MGDALAGFLFTLLFPNGYGVFFRFSYFDDFDVAGHLSDLAETCCAGRLRAGGGGIDA